MICVQASMRNAIFIMVFSIISTSCVGGEIARFDQNVSLEEVFEDENVRDLIKGLRNGDLQSVERQIIRGTDLNHRGKFDITPLYWLLFKHDAPNKNGFQFALKLGAQPLSEDRVYNFSPLLLAAGNEDPYYLEQILQLDINVDHLHKNALHGTALIRAIVFGNFANVQNLISSGADVNFPGPNLRGREIFSDVPIINAYQLRDWKIVYLLLKAGANYEITFLAPCSIVCALEEGGYLNYGDDTDWRGKVIGFLNNKGISIDAAD